MNRKKHIRFLIGIISSIWIVLLITGFRNDTTNYRCPIDNSEFLIPAEKSKFYMGNPSVGSIIYSTTDSLIYPIMEGRVIKIIDTNSVLAILIKHNDTLLSVYSDIDKIIVDKGDMIDNETPIAIAKKTDSDWRMFLQIWVETRKIHPEKLIKCD